MILEDESASHKWSGITNPHITAHEADGVPFSLKSDRTTWNDITIARKDFIEDGKETLLELVGHRSLGVVGLRRFDYDFRHGIWSGIAKTAENPHADPEIHMEFGFTQGINGIRRNLNYHYQRGEDMFMLADIPDKPDVFRGARGIYNSFGVMMGFQSEFLFPERKSAFLQVYAGEKGFYKVDLCSVNGKRLLDIKTPNNEEVDLGEGTSFHLHEAESGRTTVGISYSNSEGEYRGHILSYPPRVAVGEYADHIRTRFAKDEDTRVIESFPQSFYNDMLDTEISDEM